MVLGLLSIGVLSLVFVIFAKPIILLFIRPDEPQIAAVVGLATQMLYITAVFQLFDALRNSALGGLRGLHDVRIPLLVTILGYWLIAIPVSYVLGFLVHWNTIGIWMGLGVGDVVCGLIVGTRLLLLAKQAGRGR